MAEIAEAVQNTLKKQEVSLLARAAEGACCFLSWTLLASAHRHKYSGLYEADNYTPLNFMLATTVFDFCFVVALVVAQRARLGEPRAVAKAELIGSAATFFLLVLGFVAGAASSTQLHDEFGGASVCSPSGGTHQQKRKADYFCPHVDAAVSFACFAAVASGGSLFLVLRARGVRVPSLPNDDARGCSDEEEAFSASYDNVLRDPDGRTFEPAQFASASPMEGLGASDVKPQEAAIDP